MSRTEILLRLLTNDVRISIPAGATTSLTYTAPDALEFDSKYWFVDVKVIINIFISCVVILFSRPGLTSSHMTDL